MSRVTLLHGIKELRSVTIESSIDSDKSKRIRKKGGGRRKATQIDAGLIEKLKELVCPHTVGDPMRALLWTSKSTRKLAEEMQKLNFKVSYNVVNRLLQSEGFSLQSNKKTNEGGTHQDRDAQFQHINKTALEFTSKSLFIILEVVVNLISGTTTAKGLKIKSKLDTEIYEKGIKISDKEMLEINLSKNEFHGEWNYIIKPKK